MDRMTKPKALEEFYRTAETLVNPEVENWRQGGGQVVGYFCSAMPEELITAAGLIPFRIRAPGSTSTELADAYFGSTCCSFPRHCLNMSLQGAYDFLDGLVMFNSCDPLRRLYDNWIRKINTPFVQMLNLPKKAEAAQVEFFADELNNVRRYMEEHFKVEITDDKLRDAIKDHNETRRLLKRLYELRKGDNPSITGADTLAITVAGTAMPKKRFNLLLAELLDEIDNMERAKDYRARLMIIGSLLDDPRYLEIIEDQGGLVVTDSLCLGSRLIWGNVEEDAVDPLTALAQYYLADRPSCPRMFTEYQERSDYIRNLISDFRVDGAIMERLAFCDLWGFEGYSLQNDFKHWNIPFMIVEREYALGSVGQLRTRVQAFLEKIGR